MRRIFFTGKPSTKKLDYYTHPKMMAEVTPLVVMQDGEDPWGDPEICMGILLQCTPLMLLEENPDEQETPLEFFEIFEGHSGWIEPVRLWRALQLLEAMPAVESCIFGFELYVATGRYAPGNDFDNRIVSEVQSALEDGYSYDEIMSRPVPMQIVRLLIQLVDEGLDVDLTSVTDEIDAETIRWSQDLKRIGVEHPDYRRAVKAALDQVTARYEPYLFSYAAFRDCPYARDRTQKGFLMIDIEWHIYNSIERGIERQHGADIAALLSILTTEIQTDTILEDLEKRHPRDREGHKPFIRPEPEQRFQEVLTWFFQNFITVHAGGSLSFQQQDCADLLHDLHDRWDTLPIVSPLV